MLTKISSYPLLVSLHLLLFLPTTRVEPSDDLRVVSFITSGDNGSALAGISEREAAYDPFWAKYDCHPCVCDEPDKARCQGPNVKVIPSQLNPFLSRLEILDAPLVSLRTDSFKPYSHLRHLKLSNCSIIRIEAFAFRGLAGLESLIVAANPLTHLGRYAMSGLFNVRLVDLTGNGIRRIHSLAFESSSYIKRLFLHGNPLSHISARAFAGLKHVETLVISNEKNPTPVGTLEPDAFWGLESVGDLYLSKIPMTRLTPFSFRGLGNVAHLYLQKTAVIVVESHAFSGLFSTSYLHLDQSKIRHIQPAAFADMINVSYVDLSKNQLYELTPASLEGVVGIVGHLDLMENPWHCNCSIHWMYKAANLLDDVTVVTRSMMSLRCHTPPEMRSRYLAQLDDRIMRCPTDTLERRIREGEESVSSSSSRPTETTPTAILVKLGLTLAALLYSELTHILNRMFVTTFLHFPRVLW